MSVDTTALREANLPILWILGGPGSGKGTQCELIANKYGYIHLSTGDLLRNEVLSGSMRGLQLFKIMESGELVPVKEVLNLLAEAMLAKVNSAKGFLLDGFPADVEQAELFIEMVATPTGIIVFEANDIVLAERLKARGNFDDNEESVAKRIATFNEKTRPLLEKYAKSVKKILAERSAEPIFGDVCKVLG